MLNTLSKTPLIHRLLVVNTFLSLFLLFFSSPCPANPPNLFPEDPLESIIQEPVPLTGMKQVFPENESFFSANREYLFSFEMLLGLSVLGWLLYVWFSQKNPTRPTESRNLKSRRRRFFMSYSSQPEVYRIYRDMRL